jgi:uncharacterized protein YhaN
MCKDTITLIVSIATVLISIATFSVAYSQMKIASAKTKLDLYNKRFAVYVSALDYYQATWNEPHEKIKERGNQFTKLFREAQFLFEPSDGVNETLKKIQQNGSIIHSYEKHKYERENNLTNDRLDLNTMNESSMKARLEFEQNLLTLEKQIEKYIQFKTISGWDFFQ